VETRDPTNPYLPIAPATGLGEVPHRRRASFDQLDSSVPYSMRQYLTRPLERPGNGPWKAEEQRGEWLRQNAYMMGPGGGTPTMAATREENSVGSVMISSGMTGSSSTTGSGAFDMCLWAGGWADGSGSSSGGWSTECVLDEDDDQDMTG